MSKEDYIITEKDYIAWCRMCTLADVMKDCKKCKFNIGLKYRKEDEMSQQYQVGKVATSVVTEDEVTKVTYHSTPVVKFSQNEIVLNHGGWKTATTKTRMNQAANQFELGYSVFQKDFEWFIDYQDKIIPFDKQEVTLSRNL